MFNFGWLRSSPHRLSTRRSVSLRRWVRPSLEALEDRTAPALLAPAEINPSRTSHVSDSGETSAHPSAFQAAVALFIDGAALEATNLVYEFIHGDDFNADNYFGSPSQLAIVRSNAAAAGINYDAVQALSNFLNAIRPYSTIQPDIAANGQYAGPYAEFALKAGAQAVYQAAQIG